MRLEQGDSTEAKTVKVVDGETDLDAELEAFRLGGVRGTE